MRYLVAICLIYITSPLVACQAIAQVPVPPECAELAYREGFPTDYLSEAQLRQAKRRLLWLRIRHPLDPAVRSCHRAVKKYENQT